MDGDGQPAPRMRDGQAGRLPINLGVSVILCSRFGRCDNREERGGGLGKPTKVGARMLYSYLNFEKGDGHVITVISG